MDLPRPRTHSLMSYSSSLSRSSIPPGANQHWQRISRGWKVTKPRRPLDVCFNLSGPCQGELSDVVGLGLKLVHEALAKGDKAWAEAALRRIQTVKKDYEVQAAERRLVQLMNQYQASVKK